MEITSSTSIVVGVFMDHLYEQMWTDDMRTAIYDEIDEHSRENFMARARARQLAADQGGVSTEAVRHGAAGQAHQADDGQRGAHRLHRQEEVRRQGGPVILFSKIDTSLELFPYFLILLSFFGLKLVSNILLWLQNYEI